MTDEHLLQEILRSPLDDMPERSLPPRRTLIGAFVAVLVVGVVGFGVVSGGGDTPGSDLGQSTDVVTPGETTLPDPSGDVVATTAPVAEAVAPEANGGFHEWVSIGDGELLMFGGFIGLGGGGTAPFEGTWRFDVSASEWSVEDPDIAPSPRYGHAMAYHPPTGRVIVFGGGTTTPRPCPRIRLCPGPEDNQLWQYDPATGIWEDMTPPVTEGENWPIPRFGMQMVYEPVTERLVLFGGVGVFGENFTPNFWNDTWAYDPATNEWEDLSAPDEEDRPQGSVAYGMVWHDETARILMFGGDGIPDDPQTLYAFDPATNEWEDLGGNEPGEGPKDRWFHNMVIDPQTGRMVLIGGNGSIYRSIGVGFARSNGNLDEVWTWSPAEGWTLLAPMTRNIVAAAAAGYPETLEILFYPGDDVVAYDATVDAWRTVWERPEPSDG